MTFPCVSVSLRGDTAARTRICIYLSHCGAFVCFVRCQKSKFTNLFILVMTSFFMLKENKNKRAVESRSANDGFAAEYGNVVVIHLFRVCREA